jgi:ribonuclease D
MEINYTFIDNNKNLADFCTAHKSVSWLAFDTEFVGERRYNTLLCLIQIASEHGYYLIDPLIITDLSPFLDLMQDEKIMKITHAGENDYRLLYQDYKCIPKNVFDTQVAAGFLGHGYPVSYSKLVERELNVRLDKGYAVADWEARPFSKKQLVYAINDVVHLYGAFSNLKKDLELQGRYHWALSEMQRFETAEYYYKDPDKEALSKSFY